MFSGDLEEGHAAWYQHQFWRAKLRSTSTSFGGPRSVVAVYPVPADATGARLSVICVWF